MQQKILVGTTQGLYELNKNQRTQFIGHEVRSLVNHGSSWWAIIDQKEIWRSDINGSWNFITAINDFKGNCLLATTDKLFVGTSDAHLFTLKDKTLELVLSFEKTKGRENWYTPWGGPPDVRSMASDPSDTTYVNVHVGGVIRSPDGGRSWQQTIDLHADVHQIIFDPDSGLLLAASAHGLAVSHDDGESWQFITGGLHGNYLRAVAIVNRTIFVTASTGPSTNRAAVYYGSLNETISFERCRQGLPEWFSDNIDTFCLAASDTCVSFGTSDGLVFSSFDKGQSWNLAAKDLPSVRCVAVV